MYTVTALAFAYAVSHICNSVHWLYRTGSSIKWIHQGASHDNAMHTIT